MGLHLLVDVAELRVAIGMLLALQRLGGSLQAEAVLPQQPAHRGRGHRVTLSAQFLGQMPQRLCRPAQRGHRVPAFVRLHQRQQRRDQIRVHRGGRLTTPAWTAGSSDWQRIFPGLELGDPAAHGGRTDSCGLRDRPHPAVTE